MQPTSPGGAGNSTRWWIITLLFIATTINYLDRGILGVLLPEIQKELSFSQAAYGEITFWFQFAYGIGALFGARLLSTHGTRVGFAMAAGFWSLAGMLTALATTPFHFGALRLALGLGESPNFPAINQALAEWFPASQKAMAMGLVNFGVNFASVIGPPLFIWIAMSWSWQACFAIMGTLGFLWIPLWLLTTPKEAQSTKVPGVPLLEIVKYKQTWGYIWGKFLTDPAWWFYLFWLPTYLTAERGLTPTQRGYTLSIIYAVSGIGGLAGGAASSYLMKRGWAVGKARKTVMLLCAAVMPFSAFGMVVENTTLAVALFALAMAAHQAWSTTLLTTPADLFPKNAAASANACGVFSGSIAGALFSGLIPGYLLAPIGYAPIMITMSCFYLVAWVVVHKCMGNLEMVQLREG